MVATHDAGRHMLHGMSTVPEGMDVFDRRLHRQHRARAAADFGAHDFLFQEVAERLSDRLMDVDRTFAQALVVGGRGGLPPELVGAGRKVESAVTMDLAPAFAAPGPALVGDEEFLPIAEASVDLVFSVLSLHWVNDLPGALVQMRRALKPDGLLLVAILGGDTLFELRQSLMEAEMEVENGVSPRVSPFADVRDAGALLQRAGFALPVTDSDTITVSYGNPFRLLQDLRGMGEQNVVHQRRHTFLRRETLMRAMALYGEKFAGPDGRVPATFQIIQMTGWTPDPSQQQPLRPGSAVTRLAEALGDKETKI